MTGKNLISKCVKQVGTVPVIVGLGGLTAGINTEIGNIAGSTSSQFAKHIQSSLT